MVLLQSVFFFAAFIHVNNSIVLKYTAQWKIYHWNHTKMYGWVSLSPGLSYPEHPPASSLFCACPCCQTVLNKDQLLFRFSSSLGNSSSSLGVSEFDYSRCFRKWLAFQTSHLAKVHSHCPGWHLSLLLVHSRHCRTHPLNDSYRWHSCIWFAVCDHFLSFICVHSPTPQLTHQIPPTTFFTKLITKFRSLSHGPWLSRKGMLISHPQQKTIPVFYKGSEAPKSKSWV